jgi:hypothetical protein
MLLLLMPSFFFSLSNMCVCVFVECVRKRNHSLIVFIWIRGMREEKKEKVNALQSSKKNISKEECKPHL